VQDGNTGVLVTPHDEAALASALTALLRDPVQRSRMGARARERARDVFTARRMAAGVEAVWREVLSDS
jgi:glycosyltransferase involved in cell wall biosynthesis